MPTMEKKRLLKLARLLEEDASNGDGMRFDLSVFGEDSRLSSDPWVPSVSCRTTGCAVGLACTSGAFKRAGLGYRMHWSNLQIVPVLEGVGEGWGIEEKFFGITREESQFLFQDYSYPRTQRREWRGERAVARRIRLFVQDRTIAVDAKVYS